MQYLWQFYLLIAVIFAQGLLLLRWGKFGKWAFAVLCFVELAFLAGFRSWDIGNDTLEYVQAFVLSIHYPELLRSHMEGGYLWYNRFLANFTTNPQMLLITTSIFIIGVWLRAFYKYSISFLFSVILFVILGYGTTLTMIRQEISTCIILLAVPFIVRRQILPFLIMVGLAFSFHETALLAVALYFLYTLPLKPRYVVGLLLGTFGIFLFLAPILEQIISITGRYGSYRGNILLGEETKVASLVKTAIQFAITGFCFYSYRYIMPKAQQIKSYLNVSFLLWCSLIAFCLQFISIRGTVLQRLVLYFSAFNFISIPYFAQCYPKQLRILVTAILVFCFILYTSIVFVYRPEWNHVLPFEFCF